MRVLVTGGCGFIGSAVIRYGVRKLGATILNVDKLTYAANPEAIEDIQSCEPYGFLHADICDTEALDKAFVSFAPTAIMHLAAESHVDRSIDGPGAFIHTNLLGTYRLLEAARRYWLQAPPETRSRFRLHHISTDEVFGSLDPAAAGIHRVLPLSTTLTIFCVKSRFRSSGAGLGRNLRPTYSHYELLQQLRSLAIPRKAYPADDHQGLPPGAATGLRRGAQCSRLALCRRPCAGAVGSTDKRARGYNL